MTIKVGDHVPQATFTTMTKDGPVQQTADAVFKGRTVVIFAVPGAFTPTCHKNHLPGFLDKADAFKAKGVDTLAVTGVNDVFVMDAWARDAKAGDKIVFLADGSGHFAKALGLDLDLGDRGMGLRSQRYSMLVKDGVVERLNIEETPGKADLSGADHILAQI